MKTPEAVKHIRARRERRQDWQRLMEAVNEDWKPGPITAYEPERQPMLVQAPVLMQKWWKVGA